MSPHPRPWSRSSGRSKDTARKAFARASSMSASRPPWSTPGGDYGVEETRLRDRLAAPTARGGAGGVAELLPASTYIHQSAAFRKTGGKGITYPLLGDGHI